MLINIANDTSNDASSSLGQDCAEKLDETTCNLEMKPFNVILKLKHSTVHSSLS
jgi:hypothetical protein